MSSLVVTESAMRPAAPGVRECFYCHMPVGTEHRAECVTVVRKAKVRMIVEYEIDVPASWGKDLVEFHRNEGSWCADNAIAELDKIHERDRCLCQAVRFECLEVFGEPTVSER